MELYLNKKFQGLFSCNELICARSLQGHCVEHLDRIFAKGNAHCMCVFPFPLLVWIFFNKFQIHLWSSLLACTPLAYLLEPTKWFMILFFSWHFVELHSANCYKCFVAKRNHKNLFEILICKYFNYLLRISLGSHKHATLFNLVFFKMDKHAMIYV